VEEDRVRAYENKVLKKIVGPKRNKGSNKVIEEITDFFSYGSTVL
jgi:hypothetical protein